DKIKNPPITPGDFQYCRVGYEGLRWFFPRLFHDRIPVPHHRGEVVVAVFRAQEDEESESLLESFCRKSHKSLRETL
ncbi:hypothetical protein, partial [Alistipes putredinis]